MKVFLLLATIIHKLATLFVLSEGAVLVSEEFTVYADQNLTLTCQPRDSPPDFVFWYRSDANDKDREVYQSAGSSYTITKATIKDMGIYACSVAEWGSWGIKSYILVNVIVPGDQSCAHGWHLHKDSNACYLYSARSVMRSWYEAGAYCKASKAQLAHLNQGDLRFMSRLGGNNRNESSFWLASARGARGNFSGPMRPGEQARQCSVFNKIKRTVRKVDCSRTLPFICQRVLPRVPKDVCVEHITSSTARVGWTVASSNIKPHVYHVEMTSFKNVVRRTSSKGRSVTFTGLTPGTLYRVRVQAENRAGNGSSSSFVTFKTKAPPPIIVSSPQNATVIAGQSITLRCTHSRGDISWYKQERDEPFGHGQLVTIEGASSSDEGTYYCASENGPKGSIKVFVIVPPVISYLKGVLLKQKQDGDKNKQEVILMCKTANRHSVHYTWTKDGEPLTSKTDSIRVSLENKTGPGLYECHVSNVAGIATESLTIAPIGQTEVDADESGYARGYDSSMVYITAIGLLSFLLLFLCVAFIWLMKTGKLTFKKKITRKLTTQSSSTEMTPVELAVSEDGESPNVVLRSPDNVTQHTDDVFPYEVVQAWFGERGPYLSLRRGESTDEYGQNTTQSKKPDYFNISPSNRNDSAANCMYAPLMLTQDGGESMSRPYVNVDDNGP